MMIFPRSHADRQWPRSLQNPVQLRPYGPWHEIDGAMPRLIMQVFDHLKAELILNVKMNTERQGCCRRKIH
jgi:hypothetical protein